ncbi:MAG: hypothetical protein ACK56F_02855, partial [bacterium]
LLSRSGGARTAPHFTCESLTVHRFPPCCVFHKRVCVSLAGPYGHNAFFCERDQMRQEEHCVVAEGVPWVGP